MAWALAVSSARSEEVLVALRLAGEATRRADFACRELLAVAWSLAAVSLRQQGHVARRAAEQALAAGGEGLMARSLWCLARLHVSSQPLRLGQPTLGR